MRARSQAGPAQFIGKVTEAKGTPLSLQMLTGWASGNGVLTPSPLSQFGSQSWSFSERDCVLGRRNQLVGLRPKGRE